MSELYWDVFCATGDPMAYVLYRTAQEETRPTV
jgi:hypothetical protein